MKEKDVVEKENEENEDENGGNNNDENDSTKYREHTRSERVLSEKGSVDRLWKLFIPEQFDHVHVAMIEHVLPCLLVWFANRRLNAEVVDFSKL